MDYSNVQARFNAGVSTALEIRKLFCMANYLYMAGELEGYRDTIIVLYRELYPEMKKPDRVKHINIYEKIDDMTIGGFEGMPVDAEAEAKLYKALNDWELRLRVIAKKKGLTIPDSDDASEALGSSKF